MRRRQLRVLQQPQAMTAISSIFFRLSPALDRYRYGGHFAVHDLNRELPVLQAARAKPFYLGALGSYRTHTLRLQKLPRAGIVQEEQTQIRAPVDIPQSPGCAYSGTLRAGRSRLCTSPSGGGLPVPAPVVLILAAGRGERFLASGGNTHKCIGWRQSPEVAPYRWPFEENGRTLRRYLCD